MISSRNTRLASPAKVFTMALITSTLLLIVLAPIPKQMPGAPMVSAIIIFLNGERYIAEAIESIRAQTFADWELILVDDGTTDGATAIARRYAAEHPGRIIYTEHPGHENRGMSASRTWSRSNSTRS